MAILFSGRSHNELLFRVLDDYLTSSKSTSSAAPWLLPPWLPACAPPWKSANQALMTAFQAASAEMYNATQGQAGPQPGADFQGGAQAGNQGGNNQGAAEDVDFEEVK